MLEVAAALLQLGWPLLFPFAPMPGTVQWHRAYCANQLRYETRRLVSIPLSGKLRVTFVLFVFGGRGAN